MSKGLQLHEYLMPHYFQHEHFKRCLFFTVLLRAELFTNNYISIFEYRSVEAAHPPQLGILTVISITRDFPRSTDMQKSRVWLLIKSAAVGISHATFHQEIQSKSPPFSCCATHLLNL